MVPFKVTECWMQPLSTCIKNKHTWMRIYLSQFQTFCNGTKDTLQIEVTLGQMLSFAYMLMKVNFSI